VQSSEMAIRRDGGRFVVVARLPADEVADDADGLLDRFEWPEVAGVEQVYVASVGKTSQDVWIFVELARLKRIAGALQQQDGAAPLINQPVAAINPFLSER